MTMLRSRFVAQVAASALLSSSVAFAGVKAPAPDAKVRKQASVLYEAGLKAFDAGDAELCLAKFEEAYRTLPKPVVLVNIAACKERRGDYAGALETLQKYLADRPDAPDRAAVESRIADLKKTPGVVTVASTPAGAAIWVDGSDAAKITPADVSVPPGEHVIALKREGYESAEQSVTVALGERSHVELTLATAAPEARPDAEVNDRPKWTSDEGYHPGAAFWVAVGGTVAAAGVTTVFGVMALSKHSQFEDKPTRELYDDGRRDAVISDVALGVASACAVTAGVLFFTSRGTKEKPPSESAVVIAPSFSTRGGGLVGNVRF
jgi:hypothetical protein